MRINVKVNTGILALAVVIVFAIISVSALFLPGLIPTHDGEYHILRFWQFNKSLTLSTWYPRWAPDFNSGYGIPLFLFVYPLPNYVAALLHAFGMSFINSFKYNLIIATVFGAIFFYLWARQYWGEMGGVMGSIFYTFAPYHLVDIFVRGSVGEVWVLAWLPAVLWMITKAQRRESFTQSLLAGIFFALLIFSHNILALLSLPFIVSYMIFLIVKVKRKKKLALLFFLILSTGVCLSTIFWLPAIAEKQFVQGLEVYNVSRNFPELYQLIIPSWGTGFSGNSPGSQGMSYQVGIANLLVVFVFLAIFFVKRFQLQQKSVSVFFLVWFFLISFLLLRNSEQVWRIVPFLHFAQFPWRYLSLMILVSAFLAGGLSSIFPWKKITLVVSISFLLLTTYSYTKPAYYHLRNDEYYFSRANFTDGTNSPGNVFNTNFMNKNLGKANSLAFFQKGTGSIVLTKNVAESREFSLLTSSVSQIVVNVAFFPGWTVYVDKQKIPTYVNNDGLITFTVLPGKHNISVIFADTMIRAIAKTVSIVSFFVVAFTLFFLFWHKQNENRN